MKSSNVRLVQSVIKNDSKNNSDSLSPQSNVYMMMSTWKTQEMKVTEALNEAKDNEKYLQTLEKFIDPLYNGTPEEIKDTLPALMNSIKMIHTIARYYNTNDRMTELFRKITITMVETCKRTIQRGKNSDEMLWEYPPEELLPVFKSCIDLNIEYQHQYKLTKERLMSMPKGKQFDFSSN